MPRSKVSIREAKLRYRLLRAVQRVLKKLQPKTSPPMAWEEEYRRRWGQIGNGNW
jgi:hypothetical protein